MYRVVNYETDLIAEVRTYKEAVRIAEEFYKANDGDCEIDIIDIEDGEDGINY